jgi:hypothetical protein
VNPHMTGKSSYRIRFHRFFVFSSQFFFSTAG